MSFFPGAPFRLEKTFRVASAAEGSVDEIGPAENHPRVGLPDEAATAPTSSAWNNWPFSGPTLPDSLESVRGTSSER